MTELERAIDDYWSARTHAEEHWAYVRMLRLGAAPSYGESAEEVERIKNCPDCPPWNVPLDERGFGT